MTTARSSASSFVSRSNTSRPKAASVGGLHAQSRTGPRRAQSVAAIVSTGIRPTNDNYADRRVADRQDVFGRIRSVVIGSLWSQSGCFGCGRAALLSIELIAG